MRCRSGWSWSSGGDRELVDQQVEVVAGLAVVGVFHRPPLVPWEHLDLVDEAGEVSHGVAADLTGPPVLGAEDTEVCRVLLAGSDELPGLAGGEELAGTEVVGSGRAGGCSVEVLGVDADPASILAGPVLDDPVVDLLGRDEVGREAAPCSGRNVSSLAGRRWPGRRSADRSRPLAARPVVVGPAAWRRRVRAPVAARRWPAGCCVRPCVARTARRRRRPGERPGGPARRGTGPPGRGQARRIISV